MKKILGPLRRGVEKYEMIKPGDRIAIGLSGGKDSTALLVAMKRFQYFSPVPFELEGITLDMGFGGMDLTPLVDLCARLDIPYTIKKTLIGPIVFEERQEKNPCSLCARMKRGALHDLAIERGCRTIALGHHADDAIETFFLSLFYEGRINTFSPVTYLDRKDITLIRPLIFVKERDIIGDPEMKALPVIQSTCPANGYTKREDIKIMIKNLRKTIPDLDDRVLGAIQNKEQLNLWF
ncbi:tRNA 2-thiocytidine biosynthesis TtcA family protein [Acetobacterium sp.]|jgi:tRNA(Ile)-lysidine synthase TilS/MesJ|uniref:tRNA 2-thiocytidine biosynthesis TtcA family protein n=1 Tax=Acetobacterium sp. TaxID=1872094 RepID=UPI0027276B6C|nr:tRNA 2-thiocytidine biosynthesis TtcA family protein [Acetobacterium sp.]MDO9492892.1 tRNA 2-thiocytidine biosynthesis TtcA family protein [Acetobacterium sp.]